MSLRLSSLRCYSFRGWDLRLRRTGFGLEWLVSGVLAEVPRFRVASSVLGGVEDMKFRIHRAACHGSENRFSG